MPRRPVIAARGVSPVRESSACCQRLMAKDDSFQCDVAVYIVSGRIAVAYEDTRPVRARILGMLEPRSASGLGSTRRHPA